MNRLARLLTGLGLAVLSLSGVPAHAVGATHNDTASLVDADDEKAPLKVTADRMVSDREKGVIEFTGSVDAVKGSLRVVADKILVFADDDGSDFTQIRATGSVRITKGNKVATGEQADYFRERKTIILTGAPTLDDGKSVATGEKVVYNFLTEEMTLLGGTGVGGQNGRATVTLFATKDNQIVPGPTPPPPSPKPTPAPVAVKPAPPVALTPGYTVQVAALRDKAQARRFVDRLLSKGYDARLLTDQSRGTAVHRIRVGRFATESEARMMRERLLAEEGIEGLTLRCENGCD
ncbi:MAG: lipopolysaccharide transport periplasmic protein LptA [Nitrospinae bacterium]|nr:lipopolysaccharide transport periplasmic protein LptA [Nitrospinota bacterium]